MMILLNIVLFLLGIAIGIAIGYWLCNRDQKQTKAKVAKMGNHELFMKRHGLK